MGDHVGIPGVVLLRLWSSFFCCLDCPSIARFYPVWPSTTTVVLGVHPFCRSYFYHKPNQGLINLATTTINWTWVPDLAGGATINQHNNQLNMSLQHCRRNPNPDPGIIATVNTTINITCYHNLAGNATFNQHKNQLNMVYNIDAWTALDLGYSHPFSLIYSCCHYITQQLHYIKHITWHWIQLFITFTHIVNFIKRT